MGDQRDQSAHRRLGLGHLGDQPRAVGGLREPDVQSDVGLPIGAEVLEHPVDRRRERIQRVQARVIGPLSRQHRDPHLDGHPLVAQPPPVGDCLGRGWRRRWLGVGHEGAAATAAGRAQVAALTERDEGLAQRRARDPQPAAELALAGGRVPGGSRPSRIAVPRRSTASSKAVCEWTGAKTVSSELAACSRAWTSGPGSGVTGARTPGRAPSRSPPTRRRASSTSAALT